MNLSRDWLIANGVAPDVLDAAIERSRPTHPSEQGKRPPSHVPGKMSYAELRFVSFLDDGKWIEPVVKWEYEAETFQLCPDMKFTPDFFLTLESGGMDIIDTKGKFANDDSVAKGKMAAVLYPQWRFFVAKLVKRQWRIRRLGVRPSKTIKILA